MFSDFGNLPFDQSNHFPTFVNMMFRSEPPAMSNFIFLFNISLITFLHVYSLIFSLDFHTVNFSERTLVLSCCSLLYYFRFLVLILYTSQRKVKKQINSTLDPSCRSHHCHHFFEFNLFFCFFCSFTSQRWKYLLD
jgi:hypothetical protein